MLRRLATPSRRQPASQQGMVLLIALVVLVAVMVAGIAMIRSVDTATLVAGNLAFEQAATHAADRGVEAAVARLAEIPDLTKDDNTNGYFASLQFANPEGKNWQQFWQDSLKDAAYHVGEDAFNNDIWFVIHRMCANAGNPGGTANCVASPAVMAAAGGNNEQEAGGFGLNAVSQIYYRITVRVAGPRRTESYVQTIIAK